MSRHHHHVLAAAAAALAASLLLTACGGSDEEAPSDKIEGAEDKESASASPSDGAAERPKIDLPKDVKYVFEWKKTGDPEKDAVLRDGEQYIKAVDMAIARQDPLDKAHLYYSEGEAAAGAEEFIQLFVDRKIRGTGTYRFYREQVEIQKDGTASLVYCEDQGKAYGKSIKTGKVNVTPVTKNSYAVYNSKLQKNENGVWITTQLISQSGATECQP